MIEGPGPAELRKRVVELEEQNARYRRMLDQSGVAMELRHRMRNTLATLRFIIRHSASSARPLEDYSAHLEDRVSAIGRAYAAIDNQGGIDLHSMIAEELLFYSISEGRGLTLSGPRIILRQQAGLLLNLAIHELAVNAVEFGSAANGNASIDIRWQIGGDDGDARLSLTWTEMSDGSDPPKGPTGFGTELILEALPYQLGAKTSLSIDGGKVICHIDLPLSENIGALAEGVEQ
jgi:two-component sensor histidine kinase